MPNTTSQDLSFLQKCTAVKVNFGKLAGSKKLPSAAVRTDSPDADRIKASKKLWDCDEAAAINTEFGRIKTYVRDRTLPSPFGDAIYFCPNTLMQEIDDELVRAETITIPALAQALINVYDRVIEDEKIALGPLFNPTDYDTPQEIRDRLRVSFAYLTFGVPENLPNAMYAREQEKAQSRLAEAVDTMQDLLRHEFEELIKHASDALTGTREDKKGEAKPKIFRDSLVTNIRDFLDTFRHRNITNDEELEAMCNRATSLLDGVDAAALRKHEPLRETVARGFQEMTAQLDSMMVTRGSRSIILEDDTDQPLTVRPEPPQQVQPEPEQAAAPAAA